MTVLEGYPRLLGREEPFASEEVREAMEADGITVVTNTNVQRVRRDGTDGPLTVASTNGSYVGDELLVAAGRRPATADLGLDTVGLTPGKPV